MSSPWPPQPSSSPFQIPSLPGQSTASFASSPAAFLHAPSPNPLLTQALLGNAAASSSSPLNYLGGASGTPGAGIWGNNMMSYVNSPSVPMASNSPLAAFAATAGQTPFAGGATPGAATIAGTGAGGRGAEISIEEVIRGIEQAQLVLNQLEALLLRRQELEGKVFTGASDGKNLSSIDLDGGAPSVEPVVEQTQVQAALLQTQSEYVQLLSALSQLASLSLFGGLPVPLSAASSTPSDPNKAVTMSDLTLWAEGRAGLAFSRREAIKAGSKAVLEVLKAGRQ